jgi:hypothetical protein
MALFVILAGFWFFPLVSFLIFNLTEKRKKIRKHILLSSFILTFLTIIGIVTHISTTSSFFDWLMLANIYLSTVLSLWWTQFHNNKFLKICGIIGMICVFGEGYTISTIGAVSIGFVIKDYDTDAEKWFDGGLIYKETSFGYVFSKVRGTRIEIYKTISWFPILEWQKQKKEYFGFLFNGFSVNYIPNDRKIYLSLSSMNLEKSSEPAYLDNKKQKVYFDSIDIR